MALFRDDRQTALDDCIVSCKDAAIQYEEAAGIVDDAQLSVLFKELAGLRREMAAELERHLRKLGDVPSDPDTDSEAARELFLRIKTALSENQRITLLNDRERAEGELVNCFQAALQTNLPKEACGILKRFCSDSMAARARLAEARATLQAES
jgi:uncharacterized protein (TIGR02284 family)